MRYKYPRTLHMPSSKGATSDDKRFTEQNYVKVFKGKDVIITEKMDGQNTTMYHDYIHARSLDSAHHPSQDWVKRFHSEIAPNIPEGWRICGENLFAKHSLSYDNLDSYFYGFSIWNDDNSCLSYEDTKEWFDLLGITHVPVLSQQILYGNWDDSVFDLALSIIEKGGEGIVMRNSNSFHYNDFNNNVAKFVRANHVTTSTHWSHQELVLNKLKNT